MQHAPIVLFSFLNSYNTLNTYSSTVILSDVAKVDRFFAAPNPPGMITPSKFYDSSKLISLQSPLVILELSSKTFLY